MVVIVTSQDRAMFFGCALVVYSVVHFFVGGERLSGLGDVVLIVFGFVLRALSTVYTVLHVLRGGSAHLYYLSA